jgi:hypothetical protein
MEELEATRRQWKEHFKPKSKPDSDVEYVEKGEYDLEFMIKWKCGNLYLTGYGCRNRLTFAEREQHEKADLGI